MHLSPAASSLLTQSMAQCRELKADLVDRGAKSAMAAVDKVQNLSVKASEGEMRPSRKTALFILIQVQDKDPIQSGHNKGRTTNAP